MATSLEGNRVNRLTINPTSDHTQESFEGNIDVTLLNSVLVHSRKKNVRVYARNTQTGVWTVSSIIGPTAESEEGLGEKHYKSAAIQTTNFDRISIVPIDATASAKIRIVHSRVLPSSSFVRGLGASKANEYELTSLATGVAQTINNITGMPIVQVFEQTTTAGAGSTELDVLRLHLDSNLTDSSTSGHTVTANGNATVSTSEKKFGAGSAYFDGSGDYLSVPSSSNFMFGTDDFTVEMWCYSTDNRDFGSLIDNRAGSVSGDWMIGCKADHQLYVWGANSFTVTSGATPLTENIWHHIAYTRTSGTHYLFIDGTLVGTGNAAKNYQQVGTLSVGARGAGGENFKGYIDDIRITKGLARYTANFTVPSAAHPDANTGGSTTLTDKTHSYTVTHDSSTNQLSVTSASPVDTIKVRIATA